MITMLKTVMIARIRTITHTVTIVILVRNDRIVSPLLSILPLSVDQVAGCCSISRRILSSNSLGWSGLEK